MVNATIKYKTMENAQYITFLIQLLDHISDLHLFFEITPGRKASQKLSILSTSSASNNNRR